MAAVVAGGGIYALLYQMDLSRRRAIASRDLLEAIAIMVRERMEQ